MRRLFILLVIACLFACGTTAPASVPATLSPAPTPRTPGVPNDVHRSKAIQAVLDEAIGQAEDEPLWSTHIVSVSVTKTRLLIRTDLTTSDEDQQQARPICALARSIVREHDTGDWQLERFVVRGHDERLLCSGRPLQ